VRRVRPDLPLRPVDQLLELVHEPVDRPRPEGCAVEISQFSLSASVHKRGMLFPPCAHSPGITELQRPAMTVTSGQVFDNHLACIAGGSLLTPGTPLIGRTSVSVSGVRPLDERVTPWTRE
jgi:hypothetical protein